MESSENKPIRLNCILLPHRVKEQDYFERYSKGCRRRVVCSMRYFCVLIQTLVSAQILSKIFHSKTPINCCECIFSVMQSRKGVLTQSVSDDAWKKYIDFKTFTLSVSVRVNISVKFRMGSGPIAPS